MEDLPEARWYETTDVVLSYRELGDGPALLLLHGGGPGETGWDSYVDSIELLAARFRVIVPDLPGFGASRITADDTQPYNAVAAAALADLLGHLGLGRAHAAGNSLGGGVALRMALDRGDVVDRLVLIAPYVRGFCEQLLAPPLEGAELLSTYYPGPTREKMRHLLGRLVADPASFLEWEAVVETRYAATLDPELEATSRRLGGWAQVEDRERRTPAEWISTLDNPTLVVWGRDDRFVPTEDAFRYLSGLRRSELIVFRDTGHWVQQEQSSRFSAYVETFLTRPSES